jgi:hypothetical protein
LNETEAPMRSLDIQQILRWIVTAIVLMVAIVLLGVVLKMAGFLLSYAIKGLLILLLIAIVVRLIGALQQRR